MHKTLILPTIIHAIVTLLVFNTNSYELTAIMGMVTFLNAIAIILMMNRFKRSGTILYLMSSAIVVPVGIIGVLAVRRVIIDYKVLYTQELES